MADDTTQTADTTSQTTTADTTQQQGDTTATQTTDTTQTTTTADTTADKTSTDTATQTTTEAKGYWPEDWRQRAVADSGLTGEEADKALKHLERFTTPADLAKSNREKDKLISSGKLKAPLPENPTPEQITAWRKDNNIPEASTAYLENLPKGLVIGDDDKPFFEKIAAKLHDSNIPVAAAHAVFGEYFAQQDELIKQQDELISEKRKETEDVLRAEWGGEYRMRQTQIANWAETIDPSLKQIVLDTTAANPKFAKLFAEMANTLNPASVILPATGFTAIDDEVAALKKTASERDFTKAERERFTKLVAQQQRVKKQG